MTPSSANLTGVGDPQQLDGANVTTSFFGVLGVVPRAGRALVDADGQMGAPPVVVISDGLWRRLFGARADIVGSTMRLDGTPFTIVGIAPPDLRLPAGAEYWRPLIFTPDNLSDAQRGAQWVAGIARLGAGVDFEKAKSAMAVVAERLARDYPRTNKDRVMTAMRLQDRVVRGIRPALLIVLGAVTLVLLVACVNVANLLLARANGRMREVAVRAAVGAGRGRLVQQFLVESVVLGIGGALAGLAVAYASTRALVALGPAQIPRLAEVAVDWRVFAFAVATAIVTSVVFGLVPALATTGDSGRLIAAAGRGSIGPAGARVRKTLVVCEMALAVVLLVGAGLLVRSYQRISDVNPGFSPDHLLTFTLAFPESKYKTSAAVAATVQEYVARLRGRPGVHSAAAVFGLPLDDNFSASSSFTKPGEVDTGDTPSVGMRIVTPGYFSAMRIPIRAGRALDPRDTDTSPEVVVINEEAARRYWPDRDPIGQQLHLGVRLASGVRSGQKTIVGVVGDVKYGGLDLGAPPEVYLPHAQHPVDSMTMVVRTAGDPLAFVPVARADLAALDRELPLSAIRTMDAVVGRSIAERRFTMLLLASFATIAVLLAAVGVYGVLAFVVSQRTQEIGLRLAIGAAPADVVRLFVHLSRPPQKGREPGVAGIGLAIGLVGALGAARALTTLLFGVTAQDPVTFAAVACALTIAAVAASYLPARRAAHVDPMEALRIE